MKKILIVFGTRPEAIKMCPLVNKMKKSHLFETKVCVTSQHREMLEQVLNTFKIVPDYDLEIMKDNQTLFDITNNILQRIKNVFELEKPDCVLVHGDTTTTFATALAAFYSNIKVGHVEAGLRTYNIFSPYPEEFNREAVSIISSINFAPTNLAKDNLIKEGKNPSSIVVTGNTAIDALATTIKSDYESEITKWSNGNKLILLTAHRRENLGKPMESIFLAINEIIEKNNDVKVVYPIHKNPLVRDLANKYIRKTDRIKIIEPLDVVDFHNLINHSYLILTDSGGIQEEAPSLGKPVLVLRDTTERPEGVSAGTLKLVGTNKEEIVKWTNRLLNSKSDYDKMSKASNPYGDGHACDRILKELENFFA